MIMDILNYLKANMNWRRSNESYFSIFDSDSKSLIPVWEISFDLITNVVTKQRLIASLLKLTTAYYNDIRV